MKQIKAIIRPDKLGDVRAALDRTGCCKGVMITEISGHGIQKGIDQSWRGEKYKIDLIPKVALDLVVLDKDVDAVVQAILKSAPIGEIGDGKIFISTIDEVIRIRTGERGEKAL